MKFSIIKGKGNKEFCLLDFQEATKGKNHNDEHYILDCPACNASLMDNPVASQSGGRSKLFIKVDLSVGYCVRCHSTFLNANKELYLKFPRLDYSHGTDWILEKSGYLKDIPKLKIDYSSDTLKHFDSHRSPLVDKSKFAELKWERSNIFIPFYYFEELIYFQLRYTDGEEPRYFSSPIWNKPVYIPRVPYKRKLVLVEGVFGAEACIHLYPDYLPVAVIGSDITPYQIFMIRNLVPSEILIYMDKTELSHRVLAILKGTTLANYCEFKIIESEGMDPEEFLIESLKNGVYEPKQ